MNNKGDFCQKRSDFRAEGNYPFWYRSIPRGKSENPENDWQHSSTLNLSAGGAAVSIDTQKLRPGDLMEFELVIPGGPVFGIAKVVRVLARGQHKTQVAVMFVSVAPKDKDRIAQVVLTDGLERRHEKVK